jgi:hypothetical protein
MPLARVLRFTAPLMLLALGPAWPAAEQRSAEAAPGPAFWRSLSALCGRAFEGTLVKAPDGDTTFADQRLIMHVRACTPNEIRIPFVVGEDFSRTWIVTRTGERFELKHDHRHADGSKDPITCYGGTTTNAGSASAQVFPADEETRVMIPEAFANVWSLRVEQDETFTYGLWRLGTMRIFQVDFDLAREVEPPPAPWGWED